MLKDPFLKRAFIVGSALLLMSLLLYLLMKKEGIL